MGQSSPGEDHTWRMTPGVRFPLFLIAAVIFAASVIALGSAGHVRLITTHISLADSDRSNLLGGLFLLALSGGLFLLAYRVSISLTANTVVVRNLFRTYRIPLSDLCDVTVGPITGDLVFAYLQEGRRRIVVADAEQSVLKATMFRMGTSRLRAIEATINSRISSPSKTRELGPDAESNLE